MNNKKLIILGNGFDLACNLKSTYKAFFENRITSEIKEVLNDALKCFRDQMIGDDLFGYDTIFKVKEPKEYIQVRRTLQVNNGIGTHSVYGVIKDSNLTFWDLIFYYSGGSEKDLQWQDIEQKMLDFFCSTDENIKFPNLNMIKKTLRGVF
ncbi:AbiH family protein [Enterococcus faecium]